jgi:hypothetical protein
MKKQKPNTLHKPATNVKSFEALVKEVGYVKARQLYKQVAIQQHQAEVKIKDDAEVAAKRPDRLHALTILSLTLGEPKIENEIVL